MANYFSDHPERWDLLANHSRLKEIVTPLEEAFGEKGTYGSDEEAMEFFQGALDEIGRYCANDLKKTDAEIDATGAKLKDGDVVLPEQLLTHLGRVAELGVFGGNVSRKYGGLNLPQAVTTTALEMFAQACPNTALTIACFSMGDFLEQWGTEEQKEKYLPKIITNEYQTSMALTEPGAGSDLGKLRTSAVQEGGHWVLNGTKQFITNGNSDLVFTLARTDPKSEGLRGLSVFIVPKWVGEKRNVSVPKIEDKVCLHASPTCELLLENSVGYLMGPEGDGFRVMADLMNGARLAMGALAVGIAVRSMEEAKEFARNRVTMGKPIIRHPMVADMFYEMEVEIRAMRTMIVEAANAFDMMNIARASDDKASFKRWKKRYRRLTPLCKYMGSERSIYFARNALQIFGGYGVCRDYPAERLLRETLIYPIYEGTSQIQSLMVLKDTLKDVASQAGGFLGSLAGAWAEAKVTRDPVKAALLKARNELNQGIRTILGSILKDKFKSDIESLKEKKIQDFVKEFSLNLVSQNSDLTYSFLCAERFTRITCDYYALKCMVDQCESDESFREWTLAFAEIALPRMRYENDIMIHRLPSTLKYLDKMPKEF